MEVSSDAAAPASSSVIEDIARLVEMLMHSTNHTTIVAALRQSDLMQSFLADATGGQGFVAVCEIEVTAGDAAVSQIDVTTRLSTMMDKRVTSCVLLSKKLRHVMQGADKLKDSSSPTQSSTPALLVQGAGVSSIKDLHIQTLSPAAALEELQQSLTQIYEPLCSQGDTAIRSGIHELISAIKSKDSVMADFKISRYVHSELLAVCSAHPQYDVKQLVDALGPKANDVTFLKDVQQVRSRCQPILEADFHVREVAPLRDEIAYWQSTLEWLEDAQQQVQTREWKLVHRILGHRVDSAVESQLAVKTSLVKEYLKYLQSIPVGDILAAKDEKESINAARRMSDVTTRSTKYPPRRMLLLLSFITDEVVAKMLEVASSRHVLSMRAMEDAFPYLRNLRSLLHDLLQLYRQQYELIARRPCPEHHRKAYEATDRVRKLQEFFDDHYNFYDSLKKIFSSGDHKRFVDQLEHLHTEFAAAIGEGLWRLDERGTAAFVQACQTYEKGVQHVEEDVALLVKSMLASAPNSQEMYRIHTQFRSVRRPTIRLVIDQYRVPLLEMISAGLKEVQDRRFFDVASAQQAIRVSVANGLSPLAARIVWEKSIEQSISQLLVKRDALSDYGWHQLLSLQTLERRWRLNDALLAYLGISMHDVQRSNETFLRDSETHGTALALAYLEVMYPDDQLEWERDVNVRVAKSFMKQDLDVVAAAKVMLSVLLTSKDHSKEREQMKDSRSARQTILKNIDDDANRWLQQVNARKSELEIADGVISSPIYTVKENSNTGAKELDVSIPVEFDLWLTDIKHLTALKIIDCDSSRQQQGLVTNANLRKEIAFFFSMNQHRMSLANILRASLQTFNRVMMEDTNRVIPNLLAAEYGAVHKLIQQAIKLQWRVETNVEKHVRQVSDAIAQLCIAVESITDLTSVAEDHIEKLGEEPCSPQDIRHHVMEIRNCVNSVSLKTPNALFWVKAITPKLESALLFQLEALVKEWTAQFRLLSSDSKFLDEHAETTGGFRLKPLRVSMKVIHRQIQLESSAPQWRSHWYGELNKAFSWIGDIPTLDTLHNINGAAVLTQRGTASRSSTYHRLIDLLPPQVLRDAMEEIERSVSQAVVIERQWQGSQQFLNLDVTLVQETFGNDLKQWLSALQQIRSFSQKQMDGTQPSSLVGGIVILAEDAQRELGKRLDQMHHYLNVKFLEKAEQQFDQAYRSIVTERSAVEGMAVTEDGKEALRFLCAFPKISQSLQCKELELITLFDAEQYLKRQNFKFPDNWIFAARIKDALRTFKELVDRKNAAVEGNRQALAASVKDAVIRLEYQISELDRRVRGADLDSSKRTPAQACDIIRQMYVEATRLHEEVDRNAGAQTALGQDVFNSPKLDGLLADLKGLKATWEHVLVVFEELTAIGQRPFFEIAPRTLLNDLLALEAKMNNFPDSTRTYQAYRDMQDRLARLKGFHKIIQDLRSDAMTPLERAERHWSALRSQLRQSWVLSELTLTDVWNSNPSANAKVYHGILEIAQGERRLETQLQHIASYWSEHTLETSYYQNKVALVKGWDALFERLGEDLNSLTAMKLSPFYKAQQIVSVAGDWDKKLNTVRQVLEVLLDVQRRWVYLDGIFAGGSAEIRSQLPNETAQFDRTSRDFVSVMPSRTKSGGGLMTAVKFVEDDKILGSLEKVALQLSQIQRALGDYLDSQRNRFPRFYFVGDDDLLEVIGSSKDPLQVSKHLKKMFAGVNSLVVKNGAGNLIECIQSSEGEQVPLGSPLDTHDKAVHEWLSALDDAVKQCIKTSIVAAAASFDAAGASTSLLEWTSKFPAQVVALVVQIQWVSAVEGAFAKGQDASEVESNLVRVLDLLAKSVMQPDLGSHQRHKAEQMITVSVYQRDATGGLCRGAHVVKDKDDFEWLSHMRPYLSKSSTVMCYMADAAFDYSYEYLGMQERLVHTVLTEKCFLTLTQALHTRLGGSPSGPAGTGKTETVKALGAQLGRFTLVFNCDESFDFKSMGRIFVGLCQVGAWGCFDEFNRLEERILSAVSQQIQSIQDTLRLDRKTVSLGDNRKVPVHNNTGIFITMNPGYAGRSNLPDNLKQLFRSVAMVSPDRENIAEVMLFAQGFKTAQVLSRKVVPLFRLCRDQLSSQSHYDFGLRALKSVLVSAGGLKRSAVARGDGLLNADDEQRLLMQSLTETIVPKLVADDVALFYPLLSDVFPGLTPIEEPLDKLRASIELHSQQHGYTASPLWMSKLLQLYKILHVNHGIMLVGASGCGKSAAWMTLLRALADVEDVDGYAYVVDPKAMSKGELYGILDSTTREWKDGVFTATLRKIVDNAKSDDQHKKRHWIIFDGDVDPEWVENLNSLLDDNKLFTLPNGERLTLPSNVRIMFEVQNLRYATPATVSRCGMVWFSADTLTIRHHVDHLLHELRSRPFTLPEDVLVSHVERRSIAESRRERRKGEGAREFTVEQEQLLQFQRRVVDIASDKLAAGGYVEQALQVFESKYAIHQIMEYNRTQTIRSMFAQFAQSAWMLRNHQDLGGSELTGSALSSFVQRRLIFSVVWGFGSQLTVAHRTQFASELHADGLPSGCGLLDVEVDAAGNWVEWRKRVVRTEIHPDKVGTNDVVIPTVDTVRHEDVISSWLRTGRPVLLCGPPGSGKTMSLTAVLRSASAQYEAVFLNFSSGTTPETILKTLGQYCSIRNTQHGLVMSPDFANNKKLIVFCDEVNLPALDKYGTQRVVQFMRQLTECQGFYRAKDNAWIALENVQFVGACNPPTDPGRVPLTHRFLRWAPVLFVDFPSFESLNLIYETYCRAMFAKNVTVRAASSSFANAMVSFYKASQEYFTPEMQRHYVYSPRELSRWSRAIYEGIQTLDDVDRRKLGIEDVIRLAVHEGLRIFRDRLTATEEREWTDETIDNIFQTNFEGFPKSIYLRPVLYSTMFTRSYVSVDSADMQHHLRERLKEFRDEEMDVELVVFDDVIEHVVRIDRVLRQPLGHMLLAGASGVGKTVLSRFVSWLNHLSVFQIKAHRGYTLADFEEDLRSIMLRAGCKREKICFIFDESNIMDSGFLEYMNALLASGEVPGLFDGDAWPKLMQSIREGLASAGGSSTSDFIDTNSEQELYKWFTRNVQHYLHVVFTMNPSSPDFSNRSATSPALFNRCTIDWFGDWSSETTFQVAHELTARVDVMFAMGGKSASGAPVTFDDAHLALANCINKMHEAVASINLDKRRKSPNVAGTFITSRHLLDFIKHFHVLFKEKRNAVEDLQRHLNSGLSKLRETSLIVDEQQRALEDKEKVLAESGRKAQDMLETIITETDKAKRGKQDATDLKAFLEQESVRISSERVKVEHELAQAEPALKDAEAALNTIKPEYLRELRAYATPPPMVKKVLEAVVILLGEKRANDWEVIKGYTRRDDFITQVKAFRPSSIADDAREKIKKNYLSDDAFSYENALRASKAAGPLHKWVTAQVRFSDIFASVGPLRAEIDKLAEQYQAKLAALGDAEKAIQVNEASIARLKETYQATTEENSRIKMEISAVAGRCERAKKLISNLLAEKNRWEAQSASFNEQTTCVMGDCLLSAAFLSYIGYFDEQYRRQHILPEWQDVIDSCGVKYRRDLSIVEYLSQPGERLEWAAQHLPQDNLCIENAIMMQRFHRYPLIVDPSGQAVEFLLQHYQTKKIAKTSFVEKGFMKQLENAVRFGFPILVQDVENIDPVLNPLLNHEVRRVGGRQLIRLGANDVDISPSFTLFLSTRDNTFQFSPDICGRVTMINFTVTLSSLQSQCLHRVMLHERPDVDEKRSDLLKLQGEYRARLRKLEQDLLTAISVSEGNILENEQLIKTLETLKLESSDIETKMAHSEQSFEEIRAVELKYTPLAKTASKLYFSLESMRELDDTYLFSLRFFLRLLDVALARLPDDVKNRDERIPIIARQLFVAAHRRIAQGTFERDHLAIGLRMAQLRCAVDDAVGRQVSRAEWDVVLAPSDALAVAQSGVSNISLAGVPESLLQPHQVASLRFVASQPLFNTLRHSISMVANLPVWTNFFASSSPCDAIPPDALATTASPAKRAFLAMTLAKFVRPDAFQAAAHAFLSTFFDTDEKGQTVNAQSPGFEPFFAPTAMKLSDLIPELNCTTPLLLISSAGYDASGQVEELASASSKTLLTVAMGSPEGYEEAERFLAQSIKQGGWVLLKNVHLASKFLSDLEKRLHSEGLENRINSNFQLFLSSERSSKTPPGLIMSSVVVVLEPPPGVKASLMRTIGSLQPSSVASTPRELPRLYFAAAWLHAVITERMHYTPLGWSKEYQFSEAEFLRVIGTINSWVQRIAKGERHNIPPAELPWAAMRRLVCETIYGGKVDNEFDDAILGSFCKSVLQEALFQASTSLVEGDERLRIASVGTTMEDIQRWVKQLPDQQPPQWLGLPASATAMVLQQRAQYAIDAFAKIQPTSFNDDDDASAGAPEASNVSFGASPPRSGAHSHSAAESSLQGAHTTARSRWATRLKAKATEWLDALAASPQFATPAVDAQASPIFCAVVREVDAAAKHREHVIRDLNSVIAVCNATIKVTNQHRALLDALQKDAVPHSWKAYDVPATLSVTVWFADFLARLRHVATLVLPSGRLSTSPVRIGLLRYPEAFLTASRQCAARAHQAPLEKLQLRATLFDDTNALASADDANRGVLNLAGVCLQGGRVVGSTCKALADNEPSSSPVAFIRLEWTVPSQTTTQRSSDELRIPLYLNDTRSVVLTTLDVSVDQGVSEATWLQRGLCLTAWSSAVMA